MNQNILYFTKFSVQPSISELEAVCIFKLGGLKSLLTALLYENKHSIFYMIFCTALYFLFRAVRSFKVRDKIAYNDGHTGNGHNDLYT